MKLSEYNLPRWKYRNIHKQLQIEDKIILILSVNLHELGPKGRLKNLVAIDNGENIIWIADIPHGFTLSYVFTDIKYENNKLMVWKDSLYCEVDPDTGKLSNVTETWY